MNRLLYPHFAPLGLWATAHTTIQDNCEAIVNAGNLGSVQ